MLNKIAYFLIFGKPLVFYFGVLALLFFIAAAMIPFLRQRAIWDISINWHIRLAKVALVLAILHGVIMLAATL